jgi:hypothetical protein
VTNRIIPHHEPEVVKAKGKKFVDGDFKAATRVIRACCCSGSSITSPRPGLAASRARLPDIRDARHSPALVASISFRAADHRVLAPDLPVAKRDKPL